MPTICIVLVLYICKLHKCYHTIHIVLLLFLSCSTLGHLYLVHFICCVLSDRATVSHLSLLFLPLAIENVSIFFFLLQTILRRKNILEKYLFIHLRENVSKVYI